eukprot:SAG31_NODE_103_length_25164_cov_12.124317_26_plen_91_part_00
MLPNKRLSGTQWGALFMLFVGVVIVNLSSSKEKTQAPDQQPVLGLIAVVRAISISLLLRILKEVKRTDMRLIRISSGTSVLYLWIGWSVL